MTTDQTPPEPTTAATAVLDEAGVDYRLVYHGEVRSAEEAAAKRGIPISQLAKSLVVRLDEGSYVIVLVPGDAGMDYKALRAHLGVRRLSMPDPQEAFEVTGYRRGTITPIGAGGWPVVVDRGLAAHDEISLGSGVSGWAIHLAPDDLLAVTGGEVAAVAAS